MEDGYMTDMDKLPEWIWVVVEKSGQDESFFALENDEVQGRKFIPVFENQEDGVVCLRRFPKKSGAEYELQAMRLDVLTPTAKENDADVTLLDYDGHILASV